MSGGDFHLCLETITQKYDALVKENADLRAEIALLRAQILAQTQNQNRRHRKTSSEVERLNITKKSSSSFWQSKSKTKIEWKSIPIDFSDSLLCVHAGKDGNIAFGSVDSNIYLYSLAENRLITKVLGHKGAINEIVSHPTTGLYASCSGDCEINIWSPKQRQSLNDGPMLPGTTLTNHESPVMGARWLDADGHLVSGAHDGSLLFWDVLQSKTSYRSENVKAPINCIDYNSEFESVVAAGCSTGDIYLIDPKSQDSNTVINHGKCIVTRVKYAAASNGTRYLITGGSDEKISTWDLRMPNIPYESIDIDRVPTKFNVLGNDIVIPCEIGRIRLMSLANNQVSVVESNPFSYSISEAQLIDEKTIVAASWDGAAAIGKLL